jgi:CD63 antigen
MACAPKTAKFLLFAFNFLFFVSGLIVLIVGAIVKSNEPEYDGVYDQAYYGVAVLLIIVGCFITVVSFFGCCGAIRESKCMLYTFSAIVGLIFLLELSGGIAAYVHRGDIQGSFSEGMNKTLCDPVHNASWNQMQQDLKCCGVNDYSNYWNSSKACSDLYKPPQLPASCCANNDPNCAADSKQLYQPGCATKIVKQVEDHMYLIGGIAIGFAFVQLLGIALACYLGKTLTYV